MTLQISQTRGSPRKRSESLKRKLNSDVTLFTYNGVIEGYVQQGICEEDKVTTKLREVFNAMKMAPSLNNCLLTGPNLNPDLLIVLTRFRQHQIAFMGDTEKAFLQISLAERD